MIIDAAPQSALAARTQQAVPDRLFPERRPAFAAPNSLIYAFKRKSSPSLAADRIGGSGRVSSVMRSRRIVTGWSGWPCRGGSAAACLLSAVAAVLQRVPCRGCSTCCAPPPPTPTPPTCSNNPAAAPGRAIPRGPGTRRAGRPADGLAEACALDIIYALMSPQVHQIHTPNAIGTLASTGTGSPAPSQHTPATNRSLTTTTTPAAVVSATSQGATERPSHPGHRFSPGR